MEEYSSIYQTDPHWLDTQFSSLNKSNKTPIGGYLHTPNVDYVELLRQRILGAFFFYCSGFCHTLK